MSRPHFLFATIAAGGGHIATAKAMMQAIEASYPEQYPMEMLDYMKEVGSLRFDQQHKDMWRQALRYPVSARLGQHLIDAIPQLAMRVQRLMLDDFAKRATKDLRARQPALIISNHGLITTGLAVAKRRYGLNIPVLTFATETHNISAYWADPWADHIITPNQGIKDLLVRMGVPDSKVSIVGYPVQQAFLHAPSQDTAREILGLPDGFCCLVSLGGEGIGGDVKRILNTILELPQLSTVIVICGRNPQLKEDLNQHFSDPRLRIEGFVDTMATFLAAADVVVGKAGPASVYETLAVGKPMLMTSYAGLNEKGVLDFVEAQQLGHYVPTTGDLKKHLKDFLDHPELMQRTAQKAQKLGLAQQTQGLARAIIDYYKQSPIG